MSNLKILKPEYCTKAYDIAVNEFSNLYIKVTGKQIDIDFQDDGQSDYIVIGGEEVNSFTFNYILNKHISGFDVACGTDEFHIVSSSADNRNYLFFIGGSGRSTIYSVYHYFEKVMNCRYFWDGDIIPESDEINIIDIDIKEEPHFEYRGLRYFAHRSLHRFQAEHWDYEDWKKEIDWLMKKKLNLFMLRIGNDDIFQKAFPDIVDYPDNNGKLLEGKKGYNDRTTAWSLKYRGELRKKILEYAFERELLHPEDCGTMTHWYTPTPVQFLEKVNPKFLIQSDNQYNTPVLNVWDVRVKENMDNYFKLTETHIKEYGRPDIFHTIGLAERNFSKDKEANIFLKKYVYKVILSYLKTNYPNSPVLIASWDLWQHFEQDEIKQLLKEIDPNQAIIFDYTSDTTSVNNFTNWGVVGKFPYIFGMFLGYSRNSDIRSNFALTEERLKIAASDSYCRGLVLWPELSHSSTFMTEYLADNAWSPLAITIDERITKYCADRYRYSAEKLTRIWQRFMPISELISWSMGEGRWKPIFNTRELFFKPFDIINELKSGADSTHGLDVEKAVSLVPDAVFVLKELCCLDEAAFNDSFILRDLFDISRTVIGRYIYVLMLISINQFKMWRDGEELSETFYDAFDRSIRLLRLLCELLGEHEDYSMLASFEKLKTVSEVNPVFEDTIKENASNDYHRSFVYESVKSLYLPEMDMVYRWLKKNIDNGNRDELADEIPYLNEKKSNTQKYFETPLEIIAEHERNDYKDVLRKAALEIAEIIK